MSRAVKVTRGNVVRGKVARGYVAARYCRRGSVARGNVRAVVSCYGIRYIDAFGLTKEGVYRINGQKKNYTVLVEQS